MEVYQTKTHGEVKAVQFTEENVNNKTVLREGVTVFIGQNSKPDVAWVTTADGVKVARLGDYIIIGTDGKYHLCERERFEQL